jgi:5-methylcytosine-specific restriction endonuclease McrA
MPKKESWIQRSQRKRRERYFQQQKKPKGALKRTPLRKQSKKQKERLEKYWPVRKQFLEENPFCAICEQIKGYLTRATETHHIDGRAGERLWDKSNLVPTCRECREWPHQHPYEAAQRGWMPERYLTLGRLFKKAA